MRMLTERGLALKAKIETLGYRAVECYPGGAQDVWGLPRQHRDLPGLRRGLEALGVKGLTEAMTGDELDAVTAALVGRWYSAWAREKCWGARAGSLCRWLIENQQKDGCRRGPRVGVSSHR